MVHGIVYGMQYGMVHGMVYGMFYGMCGCVGGRTAINPSRFACTERRNLMSGITERILRATGDGGMNEILLFGG